MMGPACALSAATSGVRRDRWKEWRPIRVTSTSQLGQASRSGSKWRPRGTPLPTCSQAQARFRDASDPRAVLTEQAADPNAPAKYDVGNHSLVLFDRGDELTVQAGPEGIRFLLVSGKPIEEPVAWYGPIVMNTQEQLRQAMAELQTGEFIKHR